MPYRPKKPLRVPAPFALPVGLGDVLKRATTAVGLRPCSGCRRRAEALNRMVVFGSRRQKP